MKSKKAILVAVSFLLIIAMLFLTQGVVGKECTKDSDCCGFNGCRNLKFPCANCDFSSGKGKCECFGWYTNSLSTSCDSDMYDCRAARSASGGCKRYSDCCKRCADLGKPCAVCSGLGKCYCNDYISSKSKSCGSLMHKCSIDEQPKECKKASDCCGICENPLNKPCAVCNGNGNCDCFSPNLRGGECYIGKYDCRDTKKFRFCKEPFDCCLSTCTEEKPCAVCSGLGKCYCSEYIRPISKTCGLSSYGCYE